MKPRNILLVLVAAGALAACDIPGISPDPRVVMREAESRAIGAACRLAVRGLEECYENNPRALKTAIFDGWRDMDQYIRDNRDSPPPVGQPEANRPAVVEPAPAPSVPKPAMPSRQESKKSTSS